MKKLIIVLLLVSIISLTACEESNGSSDSNAEELLPDEMPNEGNDDIIPNLDDDYNNESVGDYYAFLFIFDIGFDIVYTTGENKLVLPIDPIVPGYIFQYWYADDIEEEFNFDMVLTEDINLYAKLNKIEVIDTITINNVVYECLVTGEAIVTSYVINFWFYLELENEIAIGNKEYHVTGIGCFALRDLTSLISITIPEGVTSIGQGAFSGCRALTSITIPEGVTSIGAFAFYYCSALTINFDLTEEEATSQITFGNNWSSGVVAVVYKEN